MGIGADIKTKVDAVRDLLGTDCTLNGLVALGKCGYEELSPARAREFLGADWEDEVATPWAMIEVPAGNTVKENDKITVDLTSYDWIVQRVSIAQAGGVKIASRCLCTGKLL